MSGRMRAEHMSGVAGGGSSSGPKASAAALDQPLPPLPPSSPWQEGSPFPQAQQQHQQQPAPRQQQQQHHQQLGQSASMDALAMKAQQAQAGYHPHHQQQYYAQQQHHQQQAFAQPQQAQPSPSFGRSQSAFNFLLTKAKASFGNDKQSAAAQAAAMQAAHAQQQQQLYAQHQQMHPSSSMPAGVDVATGMPYSAPSAASFAMRRGSSGQGSAGGGSGGEGHDPFSRPPRPSFATDDLQGGAGGSGGGSGTGSTSAVSSPTKRSFFGMGRERKISTASVSSAHASNRPFAAVAQSPLGRSSMATDRDRELREREEMRSPPQPQFAHAQSGSFAGSGAYGAYSRSQSDLHAKSEVPPMPLDAAAAASRAAAQHQTQQGRSPYLRSPSPGFGAGANGSSMMAFSRSVDDLSAASPMLRSPSPGAGGSSGGMQPPPPPKLHFQAPRLPSSQQQQQHQQHGRTASLAAAASSTSLNSTSSAGSGGAGAGGQASAVPPIPAQHQQSNNRLREAQHARKGSRLALGGGSSNALRDAASASKGSESGTSSAGRASSLAHSLGIAPLGGGSASSSMRQVSSSSTGATSVLSASDSSSGAPGGQRAPSVSPQSQTIPLLPPGATYQGLLSRNTNISLSYAQLCEGKEKDIAKGWKPYRVVMQDGNLQFYKPPSGLVDEVRAVFPSSIVRPPPRAPGSSAAEQTGGIGSGPLDADALKRSGLSTRDLLSATASSSSMAGSASPTPTTYTGISAESPSFRQLALPPPAGSSPAASASSPTMPRMGIGMLDQQSPASPTEERAHTIALAQVAAWARKGAHPELRLAPVREEPGTWLARIQSGSLAALAHELVHATQATVRETDEDESEQGDTTVAADITIDGNLEEADEEARAFARALVTAAIMRDDALAPLLDAVAKAFRAASSVKGADTRVRALIATVEPELIPRREEAQVLAAVAALCSATQYVTPSWFSVLQNDTSREPRTPTIEQSNRANLRPLLGGTFPDTLLVTLPPQEIAQQIQAWHVRETAQELRPFFDLHGVLANKRQQGSLLSFDAETLHPLSLLVLTQIFAAQPPTAERGPAAAAAQAQAVARHRAAILRHWIAVASYLQAYGDLAGWTAVVSALCSRAVARLESTWRFVAPGDKDLMAKFWCPALAKIGWSESKLSQQVRPILVSPDIPSPKGLQGEPLGSIPFLGSLEVPEEVAHPMADESNLDLRSSHDLSQQLYSLIAEARKQPRDAESPLTCPVVPIAPLLAEYKALLDAFRGRPREHTLSVYLERSYHIEPRALGSRDLAWRPPLPQHVAANATAPLLFVNPLPLQRVADPEWIAQAAGVHALRSGALKDGDREATITKSGQASAGAQAPVTAVSMLRSKTLPFASVKGDRRNPFLRTFKSAKAGANEPADIKIGNELVLRPISESLGHSGSASPRGSKRFSQDFMRSSRPSSHVSKRSSLPASNRSSVTDLGTVLVVEVKAATLERIIDVMVMGVGHIQVQVADDNGEVPLSRRSQLSLDSADLVAAFLGTYRGICAPSVLFELLRKRFVGAINAGRELALPAQQRSSSQFPSWSYPSSATSTSAEAVDWDIVTRVRIGVLNALRKWLYDYAQDFIDDKELWAAAGAFLRDRPTLNDLADDPERARIAAHLDEAAAAFRLHILRPNLDVEVQPRRSSLAHAGVQSPQIPQEESPFDIDRASSQDLVDYLEPVAAVFAEKVTRRDYLVVSELFERQAADPFGWFPPRKSTGEDDASGTTMYKLVEIVRSASAGMQPVPLQQALPGAVRDACAAQNLLRGWIAIHLTEPRIGLVKRQERLAKILDAIFICRARMSKGRGLGAEGPQTVFQKACIASFVESALTSSVTSSESRIFTAAWQGIAQARQGSIEALTRLGPLPEQATRLWDAATQRPGTIDIGWTLGCLAEAITQPYDVSDEAAPLIPWDKYRNVWNLIEASGLGQHQTSQTELDVASARLKSMQVALGGVVWDRRFFKEEASREASYAASGATSSRWRSMKPLNNFLVEQHDRQKRLRLACEAVELDRRTTAEAITAAEMRKAAPITSGAAAPAAEKRARRMTALFRSAVRPVLSDKHEQTTISRSPGELLSSIPIAKASLVARCGGAQVSVWNNSQRSFVFHLTTAEGGKYLLQAPSQSELADWIRTIDTAAKAFRPRRPSSRGTATGKGLPYFGIPLAVIVEREASIVPIAIERMFAEIEARGLREQGIYRISGAKSAIMGLKDAFERQGAETANISTGEFSDVHTIAGLIKQWFRDLPEPCIPFHCYHRMIDAEKIENEEERLATIRELIWTFPKPHFNLLERTCQHLSRVAEEGKHNLMAPHNIGLVFGTSLLNPPPSPSSVAEGFGNIGKAAHIVKIIVLAHEWIFDPIVEAEPVHADDAVVSEPLVGSEPPTSSSTNTLSADNAALAKDGAGARAASNTRPELAIVQPESSPASSYADAQLALSSPAHEEPEEVLLQGSPPKSALGLQLAGPDSERTLAAPAPYTRPARRNMPQRETEESIYLDAQDALEVLNFNLEEPVSLASPMDEVDDPMQQLHAQLSSIGMSP